MSRNIDYGVDNGGGYVLIRTVTVFGAKGIGNHPMSPLSAAERLRELLHHRERAA